MNHGAIVMAAMLVWQCFFTEDRECLELRHGLNPLRGVCEAATQPHAWRSWRKAAKPTLKRKKQHIERPLVCKLVSNVLDPYRVIAEMMMLETMNFLATIL
jgi:hypothetical protein